MKKLFTGFVSSKILIILVLIVCGVVALYQVFQQLSSSYKQTLQEEKFICPQDTKTCPDGSVVSREGEKCEFPLCPKEDLIKIFSPQAFEEVSSPLVIKGEAKGSWFFEGTFPIKLIDSESNEIARGYAQALGEWMIPDFVPFEATIEFWTLPNIKEGSLILIKNNPSGETRFDDELKIPILFKKKDSSQETTKIKVFFPNSKLDPSFSCNKVFPVERIIAKTLAVGRKSIEELLKGPNSEEIKRGYFSFIPQQVQINDLRIENEVAYIDFNEKLSEGVAGSCLVTGIRSQIEETLKQFPTVNQVVISINGATEDILQP